MFYGVCSLDLALLAEIWLFVEQRFLGIGAGCLRWLWAAGADPRIIGLTTQKGGSGMKKYSRWMAMMMAAAMAAGMTAGCSQKAQETTAAETAAEAAGGAAETATEAAGAAAKAAADDAAETAEAEAEGDTAGADGEKAELIVFAAASMTETLTEIGDLYMSKNPGVELVFNFDSSGTLKTQIQEGADCDIFISAGQKQMDQLDASADASVNTEGLDFVEQSTRFDILENKVALAVPEDNPAGIQSYDDMVAGLQDGSILLAMGNADVPVGQYTQKILAYYDLNEEDLANAGNITYGSNVKEVTTQVSEAVVDCGIIYQTDAYSAGLTVVDTATAEMCGQVVYPAAALKTSQHPEEAQAFLDYLISDTADAIFEGVGFTPVA